MADMVAEIKARLANSHYRFARIAVLTVLDEHCPDIDGDCKSCYRPSSAGWHQRVPYPCRTVQLIMDTLPEASRG